MRGGFRIKSRVTLAAECGFLWLGIAGLVISICCCCCNAQTLLNHNDNDHNHNHNHNNNASSPDASVCANSIIIYGYECQEYLVTTGDGYILSVQRIPHGRLGRRRRSDPPTPTTNRPPVLFQHGLLLDGRSWFYNKAEANLPMILADKGYDVWISNTRGTEYSRRHQYLDPSAREFWYWTWDHLAKYDLPVLIDLVFKTTGQKVHFVGHAPYVYCNSDPVSRLVKMLCSKPTVSCYNLPTPLTLPR